MRAQFFMLSTLVVLMFLIAIFSFTPLQMENPRTETPVKASYASQTNYRSQYHTVECFFNTIYSCDLPEEFFLCGVNLSIMERTPRQKRIISFNTGNFSGYLAYSKNATHFASIYLGEKAKGVLVNGRPCYVTSNSTGIFFRYSLIGNKPVLIEPINSSYTTKTTVPDVFIADPSPSSILTSNISSLGLSYSFGHIQDITSFYPHHCYAPSLIILPKEFSEAYLPRIISYLKEGGIVLARYGLCNISSSSTCDIPKGIYSSYKTVTSPDFGKEVVINADMCFDEKEFFLKLANTSSCVAFGEMGFGKGILIVAASPELWSTYLHDLISYIYDRYLSTTEINIYSCK